MVKGNTVEQLKPYGDRILVKLPKREEISKPLDFVAQQLSKGKEEGLENFKEVGGILISKEEESTKEEYFNNVGEVIAVADKFKEDDNYIPIGIKVMFDSGVPLTHKGESYMLLRENNILYIVED